MKNVGGKYGENTCKEEKGMKLKEQEKAECGMPHVMFQHRRYKVKTKGRHLILYSHKAKIMLWKTAVICLIWIKIIHNFQKHAHTFETGVTFCFFVEAVIHSTASFGKWVGIRDSFLLWDNCFLFFWLEKELWNEKLFFFHILIQCRYIAFFFFMAVECMDFIGCIMSFL